MLRYNIADMAAGGTTVDEGVPNAAKARRYFVEQQYNPFCTFHC